MLAPSTLYVWLAAVVSCAQLVLAYPVVGPSTASSHLVLIRRDDTPAVTYTSSADSKAPSVQAAAAVPPPASAAGGALVLINSLSTQPIPVARPSLPFLFTVSYETFSLTLDSVTLTTSILPSWLAFSPESKTFSGTPSTTDVGKTLVTVTATATNGGASVVDSFQIIVKTGNGVKAGDGVLGQLTATNQALTSVFVLPVDGNGLGGVRVPNFWSFSMGFVASTFKSTSSSPVRYSAFLSSGAALPPWLTFDPSSIDFNGNAPGPSAESAYNVILCGSDVAGYADYCEHFNLVVAAHALTFQGVGAQSTTLQRLNLTAEVGTKLEAGWDVVGLGASKGILIDGKAANTSDIVSVKMDTSSVGWLAWDESSRIFSGDVPPSGLTDGVYPTSATKASNSKLSIPVTIEDRYNNTLQLQLPISIYPSLFPTTPALPILAAPGQPVSADLAGYLTPSTTQSMAKLPDLSVVFNPQAASSWLSFTPATSYLASTSNVPAALDYDSVDVIVTARDLITNATSHQTILLSIAPGNNATHGHPHRSAAQALDARGQIVIGAVFGSLAAIILLCLLLSCCRKHCAAEKHVVDEKKTAEEHGWKDNDAKAYGKEQMYGIQFNTEKYGYGNSYGRSVEKSDLDSVPHLTRIFMDIAKDSNGAVVLPGYNKQQQAETPLSRKSTTTTAGKFRQIVKKPFFGGMMGGRSREGSPTSGGGLKSNISLPVELSRSASPSSTLNEFDNPRRIGNFGGGGDDESTLTGTSGGGDASTIGGPGSRASWESEPSYRWEDGSQRTAVSGSAAASTPRRRFDATHGSQAASQSGDLMASSSSSHGSLDSADTGDRSASSLDGHEERAEIAQAQRVGMATPTTTRSRHDLGLSSPTGSTSTTGTVPLATGIPRLVDFKNERTVQSQQGHRSISHSAVTINQPAAAATTATTTRSKVGVPPLPYDAEAQFRFSAGLTYIPNMNAEGGADDGHSPSTSAIFFTSPPMSSYSPKGSVSQIPRLASPPRAKLPSKPSSLARTDSLDSESAARKSSSSTRIPALPTSATTSRLARIPSDAQIVYASTTEAFSFRPSLDIDADKPLRGMLKAVVEGAEEGPRKGKGLKRLPPWLKFNKGLFDGVPKIGDEGRVDVRVIESFSGLGGQAERVVARFAIEVQTGSQITRRATGRRPNLPGVSTKSP